MNFSIIGYLSNDLLIYIYIYKLNGLTGSTYLMLSHAFISSSLLSEGYLRNILFLLIGILYKRYHTRLYYYYKGLIFTLPLLYLLGILLYSFFFLMNTLANISLPFTSAFISEILILISSTLYVVYYVNILLL